MGWRRAQDRSRRGQWLALIYVLLIGIARARWGAKALFLDVVGGGGFRGPAWVVNLLAAFLDFDAELGSFSDRCLPLVDPFCHVSSEESVSH